MAVSELPPLDYGLLIKRTIRFAREEALHLTQPDFAGVLGRELHTSFARQTIGNWEEGMTMPDAPVLIACARLVGMTVDDLMAEADAQWSLAKLRTLEARMATLEDKFDRLHGEPGAGSGSP